MFHTTVPLSPAISLLLSIMSLRPPTEGCLNRWLVAGCCCALLVGLQEAAYLSACVRVRVCIRGQALCTCACLCVHRYVAACLCICSFFCKSAFLCVFVIVCPAITRGNRAGNRRGVQPEQVIKKNPCKMAVLRPSLASSG